MRLRYSTMRWMTSSAVSRTRKIWPVVKVITVSGVISMCSIKSELSSTAA